MAWDPMWLQRFPPSSPPVRSIPAIAYDSARGVVVIHGGNGNGGCADDECWGACTPHCSPDLAPALCPGYATCGDGVCTTLESCRLCPADCPHGGSECPAECGDNFCDSPTETLASCPGDCEP